VFLSAGYSGLLAAGQIFLALSGWRGARGIRDLVNRALFGSGSGGGAVRRSEPFIVPIASCLQGTILAPTPARLLTVGSVAHGH
jgi:hypothetical protein